MKPAKAILHLAAAAVAVCVTTSVVWAMANLGYPLDAAPVRSEKRADCARSSS